VPVAQPIKTLWLKASNSDDCKQAGELLKAGQLVAVPTETVYGLAADATNPHAVAQIFSAKGRPCNHPLIVHIGSVDEIDDWATEVPTWVKPFVEQFWPGPLTLLLPRRSDVNDVVTGGLDTIGLRMPDNPTLLRLLQSERLAVAAPSANPYQKLSPTLAEQVIAGLDGRIAAVLDDGPCLVGTESTILRAEAQQAQILRFGPLDIGTLQAKCPVPIKALEGHDIAVSGNKRIHYQPNARVKLLDSQTLSQLAESAEPAQGVGGLYFSDKLQALFADQGVQVSSEQHAYRQRLYSALFELDQRGLQEIWVELPPQRPGWEDIHDRLSRAAAI